MSNGHSREDGRHLDDHQRNEASCEAQREILVEEHGQHIGEAAVALPVAHCTARCWRGSRPSFARSSRSSKY